MLRVLLLMLGFLSVGLGILGAFLPVLPTTPFMLLAAACFLRSSQRAHDWLLGHRWLGAPIRAYQEGRGLSLRVRLGVLATLWASMLATSFLVIPGRLWWVRVLLLGIAGAVSVHIWRRGRPRQAAASRKPV